MLYLYTGGQFIWPGVRIGHKTRVPIPVTDGSPGGHKVRAQPYPCPYPHPYPYPYPYPYP